MNQPKPQKSSKIDLDAVIARLETLELSEALHDDHFQNVTLPILKDRSVMNYFGTLTQADQDRMQQDAMSAQDLNNPTKWTQMFFGSILSNRVRLTTFIDAEKSEGQPPVQTQESFYTNYKLPVPLFEEDLQVGLGTMHDELFLKDPLEIRAYVRTALRNLFISSTESGQYKDFIQASSFPKSVEGKKLKEFASSITERVKAAALADMTKMFKSPAEKEALQSLLNHAGIYAVLLDSINLALVDLLNQGTFSTNYGSTFKAANALLANNMLMDMPAGYKTLKQMNPEVAVDLTTKLTLATKRINPYLIDKSKMIAAFTRARNVKSPHGTAINRCLSNFANLVSNIGKTLGTNFDFDDYVVVPQDRKAEYFLSLLDNPIYRSNSVGSDHLTNAFICIESKHLSSGQLGGVAIAAKASVGVKFQKVSNRDTLAISDVPSKLSKAAVISDKANQYICNDALRNYGILSKDTYVTIVDNLDTSSTAETNSGEGNAKSPKAQLLNIIHHLFNPAKKSLDTHVTLFVILPKLLLQGATLEIRTSDEPLYSRYSSGYWLDTMLTQDAEAQSVLSGLRSMKDIYYEYANLMLDPSASINEITGLRNKFINMVQNLHAGIWSHDGIEGFGVVTGIDIDKIRGELSLNEAISNPVEMKAAKAFAKKKKQEAEKI